MNRLFVFLSTYVLLSGLIYAEVKLPSRNYLKSKVNKKIHRDIDPDFVELEKAQLVLPIKEEQIGDKKCLFLIKGQSQGFYQNVSNVKGLFSAFNKNNCDIKELNQLKKVEEHKKEYKWNFSFHFGFNRTTYEPTDMKLKSSRVDVTVKDFEFEERTSAGFYNPANWEQFQDAFRWIDEPTNSFVLTAEKKGHSIILSVFHPKFLIKKNQVKHVTGIVDGVEVDHEMYVDEPFDGYNNKPGEMYLIRFENTHMQMEYTIGYGYEIRLFDSPKHGALSIRPEVFIGVMAGQNFSVYTKPGEYWEYEDAKDQNRIQGWVFSGGVRVNYRINNFNFFVEKKYSYSRLNHGFMDGTASYNLRYSPLTFGIGYTLDFKRKCKGKRKRKGKCRDPKDF